MRPLKITLEHRVTGERVCVERLRGYNVRSVWRIVERGVTHPRGHCVREGGRWRFDRERHADRVVEVKAAELDELRSRLSALEAAVGEGAGGEA